MSQPYFTILTAIGEAKLANATALGTTLQLTQMGIGDGNGSTPLPNRSQTALVRENRRAPLNRLFVDPANASQIIAEQVIPEEIGGWWIREIGLYDTDGNLCAVANCPDTYKPVLAEGSGRTQVIRMVLIVSNTAAVQLKIDPAIVLATRGYVDDEVGKHLAAVDPHPEYLSISEGDAKISAAIAKLVSSSPSTLDTLAELANALGSDPNFAITIANDLALRAPLISPTFSGNPTGPTPAQFDDSTKLATTNFVRRALGVYRGVRGLETSAILSAEECGKIIAATMPNVTVTLPSLASGPSGMAFSFHCNNSAGSMAITCSGSDFIQYGSQSISSITLKSGDGITLVTDGGTSWTPMNQSSGAGKQSFSVGRVSTPQSFPHNIWTKVQYNGKDFDPFGVFDSSSSFRFKPTLPGKYLICATVCTNSISAPANGSGLMMAIYKNGLMLKQAGPIRYGVNAYQGLELTTIVEVSGVSDFFEIYGFHDSGLSNMSITSGGETHFSAARIL